MTRKNISVYVFPAHLCGGGLEKPILKSILCPHSCEVGWKNLYWNPFSAQFMRREGRREGLPSLLPSFLYRSGKFPGHPLLVKISLAIWEWHICVRNFQKNCLANLATEQLTHSVQSFYLPCFGTVDTACKVHGCMVWFCLVSFVSGCFLLCKMHRM